MEGEKEQVKFYEETVSSRHLSTQTQARVVSLLMRLSGGTLKSSNATKILFGMSIVFIVLSVVILSQIFSGTKGSNKRPSDFVKPENLLNHE